MNTMARTRAAPWRRTWSRDRIEYRALVFLAFFICLATALAGRLAGRSAGGSLFAQARSDAHAAIGYAFHG